MAIFESKEVEQYFYRVAKEHGIIHVLWEDNHVITREDIDVLVNASKGYLSNELTSEPFEEFP